MPLTNNVDKNSLEKITAINNCAILHEIAHFSNTNESVKAYNRALLRLFAADCCFFLCVREGLFILFGCF